MVDNKLIFFDAEGTNFARKQVLLEGLWFQKIQTEDWTNQMTDRWVLDIFASFRTEHAAKLEFWSLWERWLEDTAVSVLQLKSQLQWPLAPQQFIVQGQHD